MKVLIMSTNRNANPLTVMPIGACVVAEAVERAGHTVHLRDLMFSRDPVADMRAAVSGLKPDVIGISVRNIDNTEMLSPVFFLDDLRKAVDAIRPLTSAPIVLGGAALGVMPEEILRYANVSCAVTGDGETVFPRLLERMEQKKSYADLPGIAYLDHDMYRRNPAAASGFSDRCLAPDYYRWINVRAYQMQMASAPILTKMGCAFQCVYCTYPKLDGVAAYRLAQPQSIADAVSKYAASGIRDIEFVDNVFNAPYAHAVETCEAIARNKRRVRLQCLELNPAHFDDALLTAMERAGFAGMGITLESASDPVLHGLKKGFTAREVHRAVETVKRHSIPCAWIFMLGGPGETRDTVKETLRFAKKHIRRQDMVFFNIGIRIFPGTELESIAREQGVLSCPPDRMLHPVYYVSPHVDVEWMKEELRRCVSGNMNFIGVEAMNYPFLTTMNRISYLLGMRPPLWKYARFINRGLRMAGMA